MSKIYICCRHNINAELLSDTQPVKTKEIAREIILSGHEAIIPYFMFAQLIKSEKETGIKIALNLLEICDFLYVFIGMGVSNEMETEIEYAKNKKIDIRYFRNINELRDQLVKIDASSKRKDLKQIVKKLSISVKEFAEITGDSPQALNSLKKSNSIKYEINTLGITAKALNLDYDDLILMSNIKKKVRNK